MDSQLWHCTECGDEREFVQPACADGHTADGGECPEWACAGCGAALLVGAVPVAAAAQRLRHAA